MAVTAKDIAEKLGLSPSTVSMVLNNRPGISQPTRKLVLDTAREAGYDPMKKPAAKATLPQTICFVIYRRTGTVVADTPFFAKLTEGIGRGCRNEGYDFSIVYIYEEDGLAEQLQSLGVNRYSGVILLATEMTIQTVNRFRALNIPLLVLDCYFDMLDLPCVVINNVQGAYLATDHLIHKRKTAPGYLASRFRIPNFDERADGFYKAIRAHGFSSSAATVHHVDPTEDGAYRDMLKLIRSGIDLATCYFCDNDHIAIGAVRALRESGLRVPEDIGIAGFDNLPLCEYLDPPLTTVNVPKLYMGESAAAKLIDMIRTDDTIATKLMIGTSLVVRGSV